MPVQPLHVHDGLGLGAFVVGLVAGSQFVASLISRLWAGRYVDGKGAQAGGLIGPARRGRRGFALPAVIESGCQSRLPR